MSILTGLSGINRDVNCLFIFKSDDIEVILKNNLAATAANTNGAINIWKDDDGFIRCEAQRYMKSVDLKKYKSIKSAKKWVEKWLLKIK